MIDAIITSGRCDQMWMLNQIAVPFDVVKMSCSTVWVRNDTIMAKEKEDSFYEPQNNYIC